MSEQSMREYGITLLSQACCEPMSSIYPLKERLADITRYHLNNLRREHFANESLWNELVAVRQECLHILPTEIETPEINRLTERIVGLFQNCIKANLEAIYKE
jgi:hypothetical protein